MGIEKTTAIILSMLPWRETSSIITLFTKEHGKISGMAKGIRRTKPAIIPLERGQIIDTIVYVKQTRTLQILAELQVLDFYPSIRSDLEKTALRDIALELILKSIHDTDAHPELYEKSCQFFNDLENSKDISANFMLLWRYILNIAKLLGFGIVLDKCICCKNNDSLQASGGFLTIDLGGIICFSCGNKNMVRELFFPSSILLQLNEAISQGNSVLTCPELLRLTKVLISYCRLHMDIKQEFKSLAFIEEFL